jgi:hypothetical protein
LSSVNWEKNRRNEKHYQLQEKKNKKIANQNSETPPRISGTPQTVSCHEGRHQPTSGVVGRKEKRGNPGVRMLGEEEVRMGL